MAISKSLISRMAISKNPISLMSISLSSISLLAISSIVGTPKKCYCKLLTKQFQDRKAHQTKRKSEANKRQGAAEQDAQRSKRVSSRSKGGRAPPRTSEQNALAL